MEPRKIVVEMVGGVTFESRVERFDDDQYEQLRGIFRQLATMRHLRLIEESGQEYFLNPRNILSVRIVSVGKASDGRR